MSLAHQLREMIGATGAEPDASGGIAELRARYGTMVAVARATGIHKRTLERIASGRTRSPKPSTLGQIRAVVRSERVSAPPTGSVVLHTTDYGPKTRERRLTADTLKLATGTMAAVADAYRAGAGDAGMVAAFLHGVGDDWYKSYLAKGAAQTTAGTPDEFSGGGGGGGSGRPAGGGGSDDDEDEEGEYDDDGYDYADYETYDPAEGGYGGG